jgi:hypothetical protein
MKKSDKKMNSHIFGYKYLSKERIAERTQISLEVILQRTYKVLVDYTGWSILSMSDVWVVCPNRKITTRSS